MRFRVTQATTQNIAGLGENPRVVVDEITNETIAYLGDRDGEAVVHFSKPICAKHLSAFVSDVLCKT